MAKLLIDLSKIPGILLVDDDPMTEYAATLQPAPSKPVAQTVQTALPAPAPTTIEMLVCPKCGGNAKLVPGGISKKSGKPYQAFYSCYDQACNSTWRDEKEYRQVAAR